MGSGLPGGHDDVLMEDFDAADDLIDFDAADDLIDFDAADDLIDRWMNRWES